MRYCKEFGHSYAYQLATQRFCGILLMPEIAHAACNLFLHRCAQQQMLHCALLKYKKYTFRFKKVTTTWSAKILQTTIAITMSPYSFNATNPLGTPTSDEQENDQLLPHTSTSVPEFEYCVRSGRSQSCEDGWGGWPTGK